MSLVKGKNTRLERGVFTELRRKGLRFQTHNKNIRGTPDIVETKNRAIVFIDSDFWHGWQFPRWKHILHGKYWRSKIENNRKRDNRNTRFLRNNGWLVLRVWEHQLKKDRNNTIMKVVRFLR